MVTGTQPIRRGMRNILANWQTVAIRLLEVLIAGYALSPVVSAVLEPLLQVVSSTRAATPDQGLPSLLTTHWVLASGVIVALGLLLFVSLMCHAFVTAGNAFVYVVGEQKVLAENEIPGNVHAYRVFDFTRWWQAGRSAMWRVAGVYGAVIGIVLLTVGVTLAPFAFMRQADKGFGYLLFGISFMLIFAAVIGAMICISKAVALVVARSLAPREALRLAWQQSSNSLDEHVWAIIVIGFVTGLANTVISGSKSALSLLVPEQSWNAMVASSFELTLSAGEGAVAVISACWLLSTMIALTEMPESTVLEPTLPTGRPTSV